MRNRLLKLTRDSIPYIKQLRPLAKSPEGCLVMQELEYWFERYPDGFYKFLEPRPNNPRYKEGKSWCEDLGFSAEEFITAFDNIGVRYKSKTSYEAAEDKFQGRLYCSYFDRGSGLTYYFRNDDLVDGKLDELVGRETGKVGLPETGNPGLPETGKVGLRKPAPPVYVNRQSRDTETDNPGLHIKDSGTTEGTTQKDTHTEAPAFAPSPSVCVSRTIYSRDQLREYALAHPLSITEPEKWVHSKRTCAGEFDDSIRNWYAQGKPVEGSAATAKPADTSACPDCGGRGYYFENPTDPKTHKRCAHPRLAEGLAKLQQEYDEAQAELAGSSRS